jgi:hypothetical protein
MRAIVPIWSLSVSYFSAIASAMFLEIVMGFDGRLDFRKLLRANLFCKHEPDGDDLPIVIVDALCGPCNSGRRELWACYRRCQAALRFHLARVCTTADSWRCLSGRNRQRTSGSMRRRRPHGSRVVADAKCGRRDSQFVGHSPQDEPIKMRPRQRGIASHVDTSKST